MLGPRATPRVGARRAAARAARALGRWSHGDPCRRKGGRAEPWRPWRSDRGSPASRASPQAMGLRPRTPVRSRRVKGSTALTRVAAKPVVPVARAKLRRRAGRWRQRAARGRSTPRLRRAPHGRAHRLVPTFIGGDDGGNALRSGPVRSIEGADTERPSRPCRRTRPLPRGSGRGPHCAHPDAAADRRGADGPSCRGARRTASIWRRRFARG